MFKFKLRLTHVYHVFEFRILIRKRRMSGTTTRETKRGLRSHARSAPKKPSLRNGPKEREEREREKKNIAHRNTKWPPYLILSVIHAKSWSTSSACDTQRNRTWTIGLVRERSAKVRHNLG